MTPEELLLSLRDIQTPVTPPWWQLAPVWWLLMLLVIVVILLVIIRHQYRRSHRLVKMAADELDSIINQHRNRSDKRVLALALASWLKRVAILAYPQQRLASLNGNAWLAFLDRCLGDDLFRHGPGRLFGGPLYSKQVDYDVTSVIETCQRWMSAVSPALRRQGRK